MLTYGYNKVNRKRQEQYLLHLTAKKPIHLQVFGDSADGDEIYSARRES